MKRNAQSWRIVTAILGLFVVVAASGCALQTGTEDEGTASSESSPGTGATQSPSGPKVSSSLAAAPGATNPAFRSTTNPPGSGQDPQPSPWSGTGNGDPNGPVFRQQMATTVEVGH